MTVLMQVPVSDAQGAAVILVEADPDDIPSGLTLAATPEPGKAMATAARSLSESLDQITPFIQTVKDKLVAWAPEHLVVEFGVKLGGEAGIILAKGTAEVNLTITMTWERDPESRRQGSEPGQDP
ncbi:MAG: CU044_2847 family protein [Streptosporangiaceae bacterium]